MTEVVPEIVGTLVGELSTQETMVDDHRETSHCMVQGGRTTAIVMVRHYILTRFRTMILIMSMVSVGTLIGWYNGYSQGRELDKARKKLTFIKSELNKTRKELAYMKTNFKGAGADPINNELASIREVARAREVELNNVKHMLVSLRTHRQVGDALPDCSRHPCSQAGQDRWLLQQFPTGHRGFFLDIGAHDGFMYSNTLLMEQHGWRGICIEPIPTTFRRRKCKLIRAVVSNVANQMIQFNDCTQFGTDGGSGGLSGISTVFSGHAAHSFSRCKTEMFTTTTMRDVLLNGRSLQVTAPAIVDVTSLDVEGAELLVLNGFPFEMYCSRYWVIEHNRVTPKQTAVRTFMQGKNCPA